MDIGGIKEVDSTSLFGSIKFQFISYSDISYNVKTLHNFKIQHHRKSDKSQLSKLLNESIK